ncbi:MAG: PorV/PorQ family protein [Candidatus Marinimicrobia bacterium]|nr:PorV/PorQ family protein [Candidatus Neomarinimicrobiota bacterium]MCF7851071.1 PorV/PorQ family protein [Candidatus Neomarinimicrobiota bacterium]
MYKNYGRFISLVLLPCLLIAESFAPVGTSVAQFLEIGIGARSTGMGEAFTVTGSGAEAAFWNPAGIADVETSSLYSSYTIWPGDISIGGISAAQTLEGIGTVAISSVFLATDDMEITTIAQPEGTGEFFALSNYALGLTFSRYLTDKISVGITNKIVHEKYNDYGYSSWALDMGTLYRSGWRGLKLGMSVLHFAPEVQFEGSFIDYSDALSFSDSTEREFEKYSLPINFRFGMGMNILETSNQTLTLAMDMVHSNNQQEQYNIGAEYVFNSMLYIRSGYKLAADEGGFSAGGGIRLSRLVIDYSYVNMGIFDGINRFSLNILF